LDTGSLFSWQVPWGFTAASGKRSNEFRWTSYTGQAHKFSEGQRTGPNCWGVPGVFAVSQFQCAVVFTAAHSASELCCGRQAKDIHYEYHLQKSKSGLIHSATKQRC